LQTDSLIGRLYTIPELLSQVSTQSSVGTGAGLPKFMGSTRREPLRNLLSQRISNTRQPHESLMSFQIQNTSPHGQESCSYRRWQRSVGFCRCAIRLGAESVSIVYRHRQEKKCLLERKKLATLRKKGIQFKFLAAPTRFLADDHGQVKAWNT